MTVFFFFFDILFQEKKSVLWVWVYALMTIIVLETLLCVCVELTIADTLETIVQTTRVVAKLQIIFLKSHPFSRRVFVFEICVCGGSACRTVSAFDCDNTQNTS